MPVHDAVGARSKRTVRRAVADSAGTIRISSTFREVRTGLAFGTTTVDVRLLPVEDAVAAGRREAGAVGARQRLTVAARIAPLACRARRGAVTAAIDAGLIAVEDVI